MRRVFLLLALLLAAGARPARAQGGMPDMSKAPPRIQTIWRKVMSGGTPTEAEARALSDYMAAHRDDIVAGAKAQAAAATRLADSVKSADRAAADATDHVGCPSHAPVLASVPGAAPAGAAATQFLASMKSAYTARESAEGRRFIATITGRIGNPVRLTFLAALMAAAGKAGAAVVLYADAAQKDGGTHRGSWSGLGAALELAGDDPHAVSAYRRALAIGPRTAVDVYGLGVAYANLGDMATGIPLLTEATHLAPKFGMAWDALGRAQSCTGAMSSAVASMQKAQEVDWLENREAQVFGPESDDDRVEANKPIPTAPGVAPTRPPTPPAFPFQVPAIPGEWLESRHFEVEMLTVAGQYNSMLTAVPVKEQAAENAAQRDLDAAERNAGPASTVEFDLNIDNRRDVNAATDRVDARMAARASLIEQQYGDQLKIVAERAAKAFAQINQEAARCEAAHPDHPDACKLPWCRATIAQSRATYGENRGVTEVMIGGMSELAALYDKAMRGWFMFAVNPVTRVRLDADRREQLINIERYIYTAAEQFGLGTDGEQVVSDCKAAAKAAAEAKAAADAAARAGNCGSKKLSLNVVVGSVYLDCNDFKIGFGIPETPIGFQAEIRGATNGRHGELFVGVGNGITGVAGAAVGMQANFGRGGQVTTAGIGVHGSLGNSVIGSEDVESTINLRSSGPETEDSMTFTAGAAYTGDYGAISAYAAAHR